MYVSWCLVYLTGSNNKNSRVVGKDNETIVEHQHAGRTANSEISTKRYTRENLLLAEDPAASRSRIAVGSRNFL